MRRPRTWIIAVACLLLLGCPGSDLDEAPPVVTLEELVAQCRRDYSQDPGGFLFLCDGPVAHLKNLSNNPLLLGSYAGFQLAYSDAVARYNAAFAEASRRDPASGKLIYPQSCRAACQRMVDEAHAQLEAVLRRDGHAHWLDEFAQQ